MKEIGRDHKKEKINARVDSRVRDAKGPNVEESCLKPPEVNPAKGCDAKVANVSEVPPGEKVSTHDPEPVGTDCDVQIPECDWVPNDWETENDAKMPEADVCKENIVKTTHVSLGMSDTIDCSVVLYKEEVVVAVPAVSPTAFEKVDVEVPEVNLAKGSTNDAIAAVTFSVQ